MKRIVIITVFLCLLAASAFLLARRFGPGFFVYAINQPGTSEPCVGDTRFAVIGDYGEAGRPAADVARLVTSWNPDFIVTVGDNNYPSGEARTIDAHIGRYYSAFIYPYRGAFGPGAAENRFFPALGNHDWNTPDAAPYREYFSLPGNERYYDLQRGPVHLFVLDSDASEPDGRTADSLQAAWLAAQLAESDAPWKLVVLHHAPYSSGRTHGGEAELRWDFAGMGVTAVFAGHEHFYERLQRDGVTYITNGLGGRRHIYAFGDPLPESAARFNRDYGALLVTAAGGCLNTSFFTRSGTLVDSHTLVR